MSTNRNKDINVDDDLSSINVSTLSTSQIINLSVMINQELQSRIKSLEATNLTLMDQVYSLQSKHVSSENRLQPYNRTYKSRDSINPNKATPAKLIAKAERIIYQSKKQGLFPIVKSFTGHQDIVWEVTASSSIPGIFGTCSANRTAKIWNYHNNYVGEEKGDNISDMNASNNVVGGGIGGISNSGNSNSNNNINASITVENIPLATYTGHQGSVNSIRFPTTGESLAVTSCGDGSCHIWKFNELAAPKTQLSTNDTAINNTTKGNSLSSSSVNSGQLVNDPLYIFNGHSSSVIAAEWLDIGESSSRMVITASWDRSAKLWDVNTASNTQTFTGHKDKLTNVVASRNGSLIATTSYDSSMRLWDIRASSYLVRVLNGHNDCVSTAVFSQVKDNIIVSSGDDATVRLWDLRQMKEISVIHCSSSSNRIALSRNGSYVAVPMDSGTTRIYEIESGETKGVLNSDRKNKMCTSATWLQEDVVLTSSIGASIFAWKVDLNNDNIATASGSLL